MNAFFFVQILSISLGLLYSSYFSPACHTMKTSTKQVNVVRFSAVVGVGNENMNDGRSTRNKPGFYMIGAISLQLLTGWMRARGLEAKGSNFSLFHRVRGWRYKKMVLFFCRPSLVSILFFLIFPPFHLSFFPSCVRYLFPSVRMHTRNCQCLLVYCFLRPGSHLHTLMFALHARSVRGLSAKVGLA